MVSTKPEGIVLQSIKFVDRDILITDPCYIVKRKDSNRSGFNLSSCGIYDYITSVTYYGDWVCSVWKASCYEECTEATYIGQFCADAGLVCVAALDEVLSYNKDLENWIADHSQCAAVIKNFTGTVKFILTSRSNLEICGFTDDEVVWIAARTGL